MQQYVWDIDQEDKEELIELACFRFYDDSDFYQAVSISRTSLNDHLNADNSAIDLNVSRNLLDVINSEPRYALDDPFSEEKIKETKTWKGEEKLKLEDSYRDFLLKPYTESELEDITVYPKSKINNYRRPGRNIPKDFYETVLRDTKQKFEAEVSPTGAIYDNSPDFGNEDWEHRALVMEEAGREEIRTITSLLSSEREQEPREMLENFSEDIRELPLQKRGLFRSYGEQAFGNIDETLENPCKCSLNPERGVSQVYSILEDFGVLTRTGNNSPYLIDADEEEFELIKRELESNNLANFDEFTGREDLLTLGDSRQDLQSPKDRPTGARVFDESLYHYVDPEQM